MKNTFIKLLITILLSLSIPVFALKNDLSAPATHSLLAESASSSDKNGADGFLARLCNCIRALYKNSSLVSWPRTDEALTKKSKIWTDLMLVK
ncbi:MAG: hypothetical protein NTX86_06060 [Candidatus Dependentiae bacterium]|nr:hypothetical protein [Candidatus Dependentiae bacterium]